MRCWSVLRAAAGDLVTLRTHSPVSGWIRVGAPAVGGALGGALGAWVAQSPSTFGLLAVSTLVVLTPLLAFRPDLLIVAFLAMLWARVSDIGIAEHALPSLALPFALALVGLSLARRIA